MSEPEIADLRAADEGVKLDWAAIRAYLAKHGLQLDEAPPPRQFSGGLANLNYLIHLSDTPFVLRRPPFGVLPPGAYDMAREHRILSCLSAVLPFVPNSVFLCDDKSVIDAQFQILEYRPGLVVRETMPPELAARPDAGARLAQVALETLGAIHAVDADAAGLGDLGRPEGFLGRAVSGWCKRAALVLEEGTEGLHSDIGAWLAANQVPDGPPALLHNDFKLNNMILDPDTLAVRAVLDWDQGTRGDALFDFATLLSYWTRPGDPQPLFDMEQGPFHAPGFPERAEAVAAYARITGRDVSNFLFYRVLAMYKLSVIFLQLGHRYRTGATTEPRYAHLSAIGTGIAEFTHEIAQGRAF